MVHPDKCDSTWMEFAQWFIHQNAGSSLSKPPYLYVGNSVSKPPNWCDSKWMKFALRLIRQNVGSSSLSKPPYLYVGNSVTIELPPNWCDSTWMGFAVCDRFFLEYSSRNTSMYAKFTMLGTTSRLDEDHDFSFTSNSWLGGGNNIIFPSVSGEFELDHHRVLYVPRDHQPFCRTLTSNSGKKETISWTSKKIDFSQFSQIAFSFSGPLEIKECGARLVYERDVEELKQTTIQRSRSSITPFGGSNVLHHDFNDPAQVVVKGTKINRGRDEYDGVGSIGEVALINDIPHPKRLKRLSESTSGEGSSDANSDSEESSASDNILPATQTQLSPIPADKVVVPLQKQKTLALERSKKTTAQRPKPTKRVTDVSAQKEALAPKRSRKSAKSSKTESHDQNPFLSVDKETVTDSPSTMCKLEDEPIEEPLDAGEPEHEEVGDSEAEAEGIGAQAEEESATESSGSTESRSSRKDVSKMVEKGIPLPDEDTTTGSVKPSNKQVTPDARIIPLLASSTVSTQTKTSTGTMRDRLNMLRAKMQNFSPTTSTPTYEIEKAKGFLLTLPSIGMEEAMKSPKRGEIFQAITTIEADPNIQVDLTSNLTDVKEKLTQVQDLMSIVQEAGNELEKATTRRENIEADLLTPPTEISIAEDKSKAAKTKCDAQKEKVERLRERLEKDETELNGLMKIVNDLKAEVLEKMDSREKLKAELKAIEDKGDLLNDKFDTADKKLTEAHNIFSSIRFSFK